MNRTRLLVAGLLALVMALGAGVASAQTAGPSGFESDTGDWSGWNGTLPRTEVDPTLTAFDGTTTAPGTLLTDSFTAQADAEDAIALGAASVSYYGCEEASNVLSGTRVVRKTCVQRRSSDGHKRNKTRLTCYNASTGAATTCHHWWSQDPRGHTAYHRMYQYDDYSRVWHVSAYSSGRAPALNVSTSVAYSRWACDVSSRWIQARTRNVGVTLHGGIYAYPFNKDSKHVWDSAASKDPLTGC